MANTLSKSGIVLGHEVDAWHVTQSIDAFTKVSAYDITVSGSFTLTGSLKVSGSVLGRTTGTASYAVSSSYTEFAQNVTSASKAQYNLTDSYTLQFYHPITSSLGDDFYNIGIGENIRIGGIVGITIPVDSLIVGAAVVATAGTFTNKEYSLFISNGSMDVYSFARLGIYDSTFSFFTEGIPEIAVSKGERIYIRVKNSDVSSAPTNVAYNITLILRPV
jgi:TM2 domain-containing membrane protein YozV